MCNIAGYIGRRQAAPILLEMIRREEGYAGGYYTGITVHDGKELHSAKTVGPLDTLLAETDAQMLKGTCGFIHSRSKSGGGHKWAQPFLTADGRTSLIANGMGGVFKEAPGMAERWRDAAASLERDGYVFSSRTPGTVSTYPTLPDGTCVHSTDLWCQYAARLIDGGMAPDEAMSKMMSELPCEVVVLLMRSEEPDSIFLSRINFPMTIGVAEDGDIYFATTRLAFPEDVRFSEITLLPPMRTYCITRGGYHTSPHPIRLNESVADITEEFADAAYPAFVDWLKAKGRPLEGWEIVDNFPFAWPEGAIPQTEPMLYVMLERLEREGRLGISELILEGAIEGYCGRKFGIYVKD